jgi:Uma2 family endonuclease
MLASSCRARTEDRIETGDDSWEVIMATAAIIKRYTPEEYLALERKADFKSEFCNGFITAMSGASREHNRIAGNLYRKISDQLEEGPCEAFIGDMRVRTSPTGLYSYPDVVAVCGEALFLDDQVDTLLNPTLIVEVLSPSTEDYDRGDKFEFYKAIESLREYVLVAQDEILVERFAKQGDEWVRTEYRDIGQTLVLESIGCAIPLREVNAKVKLVDSGAAED